MSSKAAVKHTHHTKHMRKKQKLPLARKQPFTKRTAAMFVLVFAAIGTAVVLLTSAATEKGFIELESNTVSGTATIISDANASGGKAIQFNEPVAPVQPPTNPVTPTEPATGSCSFTTPTSSVCLPFDMPTSATLRASPKKVFAHYMPTFPQSIDNANPASDYYNNVWVKPALEGGTDHRVYGGYARDRPLTPARTLPITGAWVLEDMKTEVQRARSAGLDGFALNLMSLDNQTGERAAYWGRAKLLVQAANEVDPNFKIMLMPDVNIGYVKNTADEAFADALASFNSAPSIYKTSDGRLVVSSFLAEGMPASRWSNILTIMKNKHGVQTAFIPVFNELALNGSYLPFSVGYGNWGTRFPYVGAKATNVNFSNTAHAQGKLWMQPVSLQDNRPKYGTFAEAKNTENLRVTWEAAIEGSADLVQLATWNDYMENSYLGPAVDGGWAPLDISAYYLVRYKTGSFPVIKRDAIYVTHRKTPGKAAPSVPYPKLLSTASAVDNVEFTTFLKSPSQINVKIGSKTYTYNAPAGHFVQIYPLELGTISGTIVSSNTTVTSRFTVVSNLPSQNVNYFISSSLRK